MAYKKLAQVSITQGQSVVTVHSNEKLSDLIKGDILYINGVLPEQIQSINAASRQLTLVDQWEASSVNKVKARIVPSSADFRESTDQVRSLNLMASQAVQNMDALANRVASVSIKLPDKSLVSIPSVPKVIQDATAAGSTLMQNAQAALDRMGNAPAFAKAVEDNKNLVLRFINDAEDTQVQPGKYSMQHFLAKTNTAKSAAEQAKSQTLQLKTDVTQLKTEVTTLHTGTSNKATEAANSAALADKFANHPLNTDVVPGKKSAKHFADKARQWANANEDTQVDPGAYSARHFVAKATAQKNAAEQARVQAESIKTQTSALKDQTQVLRNESKQFRDQQEQLAGGDAPNALKLGGQTAQQWENKINNPLKAIIAKKSPVAAQLIF